MPDTSLIGKIARANWDFLASNADELTIEEDDLITISHVTDDGWYEGELNGNIGWFPSNYVDILTDEEAEAAFQGYYEETEEEESRRVVTSKPRVVLAAASDVKPKWFDKVDGETLNKMSDQEKKRQEVIFELYQTEKDFVRDLDIIINVFLNPLRQRKILPAKDLAVLFSNVEQLVPVNQELLRSLEERRAENLVVELVGDIFIRLCDYFKMYNMYCSNQPFSLMKYQSINSKQFKAFVSEAFSKPECRQLDMCSFLIKPVQRICKYPLLIREILKQTDQKHKDYSNLEQAFDKIEMVVTIVNEATRQAEDVQKMLNIQNLFSDKITFLTPARRLLREEELVQLSENKKKTRSVFLFNDLFVVSKKAGMLSTDKLKIVGMIPLDTALIHDPEPETTTFQVIHSGHTIFLFFVEEMDAKKKWIDQLTELSIEERERKAMELEDMDYEYDENEAFIEEASEDKSSTSIDQKRQSGNLKTSQTQSLNSPQVQTPTNQSVTQTQQTSGQSSRSSFSAGQKDQARISRISPSTIQEQQQAADLGNIRANLKRTITEDKEKEKIVADPEQPNNEAAAMRNKLRQISRTASEPNVRNEDNTPEFAKIKLRKTLYEDNDIPQGDLAASKPMSVSLPEITEEFERKVEKKKKKGFFARLFGRFRKPKKDGSSDPSEEKIGSSSTSSIPSSTSPQPQKAQSPQANQNNLQVSSNPTSASNTPSSQKTKQATPQQPQQQSTANTAPAATGGVQQRPQSTAMQDKKKRISVAPSAIVNSGKVMAITVKSFKKLADPQRVDYIYYIEVTREKATYILPKNYDDFFNFHTGLIFQFPEEAGRRNQKRTLPDLPPQIMFVSESVASQRRFELDRYLKKLFALSEKIALSAYVLKFLEPKDGNPISLPPLTNAPTTSTPLPSIPAGKTPATLAVKITPAPNTTSPATTPTKGRLSRMSTASVVSSSTPSSINKPVNAVANPVNTAGNQSLANQNANRVSYAFRSEQPSDIPTQGTAAARISQYTQLTAQSGTRLQREKTNPKHRPQAPRPRMQSSNTEANSNANNK